MSHCEIFLIIAAIHEIVFLTINCYSYLIRFVIWFFSSLVLRSLLRLQGVQLEGSLVCIMDRVQPYYKVVDVDILTCIPLKFSLPAGILSLRKKLLLLSKLSFMAALLSKIRIRTEPDMCWHARVLAALAEILEYILMLLMGINTALFILKSKSRFSVYVVFINDLSIVLIDWLRS